MKLIMSRRGVSIRAHSCLVGSARFMSNQLKSYPIHPARGGHEICIQAYQFNSCHVISRRVRSGQINSDHVISVRIKSNLIQLAGAGVS